LFCLEIHIFAVLLAAMTAMIKPQPRGDVMTSDAQCTEIRGLSGYIIINYAKTANRRGQKSGEKTLTGKSLIYFGFQISMLCYNVIQ
jgi:hypothetical protein